MKTQKGLTANIYRDDYSCAINKLKDAKRVTVIDAKIDEIFTPSETSPAVRLVRRNIYGSDYIHAEPIEPGFYAFGGAFIYTSDARLRGICAYPIPLHDRQMNLEG